MRSPERIPKTLESLKKVWEENPDHRLGQIISNSIGDKSLFYIEDEDLLELINRLYEK